MTTTTTTTAMLMMNNISNYNNNNEFKIGFRFALGALSPDLLLLVKHFISIKAHDAKAFASKLR